ncbi:MAG: hypothetical protein RIC95_01185 [Vicingaceae bacterium]
MKAIKTLLLTFSFVVPFFLIAQSGTEAKVVVESVGDSHGDAVEVTISRAEDKDILKAWKKVMKDYDGDVSIKGNTATAVEVIIPLISSDPLKVQAEVKSGPKNKKVFVAIFEDGDINQSHTETAKTLVENLAKEMSREATEDHHGAQAKILKSLEGNLKDLIRDKEKAEKDIEDCKETIKDAEYDLKKNEKERAKLQDKIKAQKEKVNAAHEEFKLHD